MKLFEERKALTESFEKLNRLFKEWERNPSALVRDSIKKKLIESYEHLDNLDRLDLDRDLSIDGIPPVETEENHEKTTPEVVKVEMAKETPVLEEETIDKEIEEPQAQAEEEVLDPIEEMVEEEVEAVEEPEEEKVSENIPEPEKEEITSKLVEEEAKESEPAKQEPNDAPRAKPISVSSETSFLSGDDEVELEKYFESKKEEKVEENIEEEVVEQVAQKMEEKATTKQEIIEQRPLPKNEPIVEEKPRISAFFTKDEKQKAESKQLTLADKLSEGYKEEGFHYSMKGSPIADLTTAIPIAKKFELIKNLFADDSENYKSAIQNINNATSLQQALDILENLNETFNWGENKDLSDDLTSLVHRRFQN